MPRLLFCGYPDSAILPALEKKGVEVLQTMEPLTEMPEVDGLVSFGYPHLIPGHLLARLPRKGVNLHISMLPWNRGSHPNFWAFHDRTPHGVTLHELETGLDTGAILLQRQVCFTGAETTFRQTWHRLVRDAEHLLIEHLAPYLGGTLARRQQGGPGSYHREADLPDWPGGWDAQVATTLDALDRAAAAHWALVESRLDPGNEVREAPPLVAPAILKRLLTGKPRLLADLATFLRGHPTATLRPDGNLVVRMLTRSRYDATDTGR